MRVQHAVHSSQAQQQSTQESSKQELRLVGPDPKRFTPGEGQLATLALASVPAIVRLMGGGLCAGGSPSSHVCNPETPSPHTHHHHPTHTAGYGLSLQPADPSVYSVATVGGRAVRETSAVGAFPRPAQPISLYEHEGCPFCRKGERVLGWVGGSASTVADAPCTPSRTHEIPPTLPCTHTPPTVREAVMALDLDVVVYPCPREGPTWRAVVAREGGKQLYPFIVDPNTGVKMYESGERRVIRLLWVGGWVGGGAGGLGREVLQIGARGGLVVRRPSRRRAPPTPTRSVPPPPTAPPPPR